MFSDPFVGLPVTDHDSADICRTVTSKLVQGVREEEGLCWLHYHITQLWGISLGSCWRKGVMVFALLNNTQSYKRQIERVWSAEVSFGYIDSSVWSAYRLQLRVS